MKVEVKKMSGEKRRQTRSYAKEYKAEAVKLMQEIGNTRASIELGVPPNALRYWEKERRIDKINTTIDIQTPGTGLVQAAWSQRLLDERKAKVKEMHEL
jgi:transposase-like protein